MLLEPLVKKWKFYNDGKNILQKHTGFNNINKGLLFYIKTCFSRKDMFSIFS